MTSSKILEWADEIVAVAGIQEQRRLDKQQAKAFKFIQQVAKELSAQATTFKDELEFIEKKIRPYVKKYSWLPTSFHTMMSDWIEILRKAKKK